jgi:predicted transposase/invertase (TIGR01784 family)
MRIRVTNDVIFRALFGNPAHKEVLLALINAVLGDSGSELIRSIEIVSPYNLPEVYKAKESICDIKAISESGKIIDIEMQMLRKADYIDRSIYYCAHNLSSQLERGKSYGELHQVICISILDFELFPDDEEPHHTAQMVDRITGKPLSEKMAIHFLELQKAEKYANITAELAAWVRFFAHAHEEGYMESAVSAIGEAHNFYLELLNNTKLVGVAADRERAYRDWASLIKNKEKDDKRIAEAKKKIAKDKKDIAKDKKDIAKDKKDIAKDKKDIAKDKKDIAKDKKDIDTMRIQLKQKESELAANEKAISQQAERKKAMEAAQKMLTLNMDTATISAVTGLPASDIAALKQRRTYTVNLFSNKIV